MKRMRAVDGTGDALRQARAETAARPGPVTDLDAQLMLQVREGSQDAASALVRRNFGRVARYIARVVRRPRAVEDLTQDVFLQILQNAQRYEPTAKFATWLYRIATNRAINYLKSWENRSVHSRAPQTAGPDVPDRADSAPERRMSLDELRAQVAAAISDLPVKQRIALALCEYEGFSYEQIAAVLDITVEAVRCLLRRARVRLRGRLRRVL